MKAPTTQGSCQVCGQILKLSIGAVKEHRFKGMICVGSNLRPVADTLDFEAVVAAIDHWTQIEALHRARFEPDRPLTSQFWKGWTFAARERTRLIVRLRTLRLQTLYARRDRTGANQSAPRAPD